MLFPIGDESSQPRSKPVITYALIGANVIIFILEFAGVFDPIVNYGIVPADFFSRTLPFQNFFWTLFLHSGWSHIGFNMLFLFVFGNSVEDNFGRIKFLIFYLLAGIGASLAHIYVNQSSQVPLIGASGAISGILGAYIFLFPNNRIRIFAMGILFTARAWIALGFWIGLQFFLGYSEYAAGIANGEGVAHIAHIGGFISGILLVVLFRRKIKPLPE